MKRIIIALMLVLAVSTFAYPCWDQFQKDAKHTGQICDVTIDSPLCIKYKYPIPGGLIEGAIPLTDDDGFSYLNSAGTLSKFDIKTGEFVWIKTGYAFYSSTGLLYNSTVIFLSGDHIIAFDKATGNEVWNVAVTGATGQFYSVSGGYMINDCYPTLWNGKIVCGTNKGEIVVVNASDGSTVRVIKPAANEILAAPTVDDDGMIYVGSLDGFFYAVNINTGATKWKKNMGSIVASTASLDSTGIYIMATSGEVLKLSKTNGAQLWSKWTGAMANGSGSLAGNAFIVASDDRNVYKLDKDTGLVKWKVYFEDNFIKMSTIVVCTKVFVMGCWIKMVTIDMDTGMQESPCILMNGSYTNISYWNGNLIFTSNDGYMYVVGHCDPSCGVCSCDSNKLTPTPDTTKTSTPTITCTSSATQVPSASQTWTNTPVPTFTRTRTVTQTLTATATLTSTLIPAPTATVTPTINPCAALLPPVFTVKMVFNPEATDNIIFEITTDTEMASPPTAVICPHGANTVSAGSVSKQCNKSCLSFTSEIVPGESRKFRILYPKATGFGDIDSVTVKGTSACGISGTSDGTFDKSVIPGQDVQVFKNVIKPDDGERCIIRYKVYANDKVTIKIYNRNGQIVKTFAENEIKTAGDYEIIWDGKNNSGKTVASGIYNAVIKTSYYEDTEKISVLR